MVLFRCLRATYYLRISADRLRIRDVDRGLALDEPAAVAIDRSAGQVRAVAVGRAAIEAAASRPELEVVYPFGHARVPVGDFTVADVLLSRLMRNFTAGMKGLPRPLVRMLVHPVREMEGGLTQIERRVLEELAHNGGARRAVVYQGRELADAEIDSALFRKLTS